MMFPLTTLALILNRGNSTFLPPVNRRWDSLNILVHESSIPTWGAPEHGMVVNLGVSESVLELVVGHVCKLVQLQLVGLVHLVGLMNMHHIVLEHIEPLVLVLEALGHSVVAPPPLVQLPQAVL
ncbi:hypothetical protein LINPERHAP1_LOCUS12938 [Linum perenne]